MCEDICVYIFGYGSLIWRPGFPYLRKFDGYIKGWKRGFWQGSTDHRGTPENPGRVVTLIKDPNAITWGTVYCIPDEEAAAILRNLDYREKDGYIREEIDIYIQGRDTPVVTKSILYVASEKNTSFLGESPVEEIATQIYKCIGPSGPNVDYLLNLADSMRRMNATDMHIDALEKLVLQMIKSSPLPHHTHPSLLSLHSSKAVDINVNMTTSFSVSPSTPPTSTVNINIETTTMTTDNNYNTSTTTSTFTVCEYSTDQSVPVINVDNNSLTTEKHDMQRKYFLSPKATVKGVIRIDSGAMMAVSQRGRSLLAAGIVTVTGEFEPHDLVSIVDDAGTEIARGIASYGSDEIKKVKGLHSTKIIKVLGFTRGDTVVHAHNMILV